MRNSARARRATALCGLPEDIFIWEVLVRLDPKSLLRCRAVCRTWLGVTSARQFLLAHHSHQPSLPIFSRAEFPNRLRHQDIVVFDHRAADELHAVAKLDHTLRLEASCDGLVILSYGSMTCNRFYVSNLATRQCELIGKSRNVTILGMYPHRPTGEHRLLLHRSSHERYMQLDLLPEGQIGCYVFALGSHKPPRYIGRPETSSPLLGAPCLVHDNLHWYPTRRWSKHNPLHNRTESKHVIVFDTIAESFRLMRAPIVPDNSHIFKIDGTLGICALDNDTEIVDIWVLQNYKNEVWDLKYRINLPVTEIRGKFEGCGDYWNVKVVSVDGDILLLVSFYSWVVHVDSDGKMVSSFHLGKGGICESKFQLKQTLVPHSFFSAMKTRARSRRTWPFI